jgi:hypothetical protein
MKIKTFLVRSFTVAAGLCAASNLVNAASQATFSDSWKDTAVKETQSGATNYYYEAQTAGSFSVDISLGGIVSSNFDSNTVVALWIGTNGSPQTIFSNILGNDSKYTAKSKSATFTIPGASNGTVTVSWTATAITVTGSAKNDLLNGLMEWTNTVASNFGLYEITLTVDSTANTNGLGTVFTYDNMEVPVVGKNTTTLAAHTNSDGTYTVLQSGSLSGAADFTPPKVAITTPAANNFKVSYSTPALSFTGTASDKYGVSSLQYSLNGSAWIPITNANSSGTSVTWTVADVDLSLVGYPGTNTFTVYVFNTLGDSNSVSRTVILVETNSAVVAVYPPGAGTVTGIKSKQVLQVANNYSVTAKPASTFWIFSQWTDGAGSFLSSSPSFVYSDTDGTLTASFAQNPFYDTGLAGTYFGEFRDTSSTPVVGPANAGYITVTVTSSGGYSGKLYLGQSASAFGLSGQLVESEDGSMATAVSQVAVSAKEDLSVRLQISTAYPGAGALSGYVSSTSWTNSITGTMAQVDPDIVPGRYNVVIWPSSDPSQGPGGYSFASATVSDTGAVTWALTLADGTSPVTSFSTVMSQDGICPIYASLYGGDGLIIGAVQFTNNAGTNTVASYGTIYWVKTPVKDNFYTNGFSYNPGASGGLYESLHIFDWTTNGIFDVDQGYTAFNLAPDTGGLGVTFNPANNTFTDTNKVTIALTASTGALSGTFTASKFNLGTNTVATPSFHGVAIGDAGWGYYTATNKAAAVGLETGPVVIQAAPAASGD